MASCERQKAVHVGDRDRGRSTCFNNVWEGGRRTRSLTAPLSLRSTSLSAQQQADSSSRATAENLNTDMRAILSRPAGHRQESVPASSQSRHSETELQKEKEHFFIAYRASGVCS